MEIQLTKEQYKDLLRLCEAGNQIYGILGDIDREKYKEISTRLEELERYLLARANEFGCGELAEEYKGEIIPSDSFSEEMQAVVDDYDDETFWNELETRLGKRDFERIMMDEERIESRRSGWYPERIHDIYEKWAEEFEKHGIERLDIADSNHKT